MNTLAALQAGTLRGSRRLDLAYGLTEFPPEIYELAETLEVLNLTGNRLTKLPDDFGRLSRLKVVFFSNNCFDHLPEVLSQCPQLSMVGFKANQIETVGDRALPPALRWLILTDNRIEQLPEALGKMTHLQKLMLAGNRLRSLPDLSACHRLELIRLSANRLETLPDWLFQLPRLSWLAYGGNPCCPSDGHLDPGIELPKVDWSELQPGEILGQGASGTIFAGIWRRANGPKLVAIKLFKGQVTSDGLPLDEMRACMAAGSHPHLITAIGQTVNHPEGKAGLVLPLIPSDYVSLGQPPSLETCTRDTYPADTAFTLSQVMRIAASIAAAAAHLHGAGILHGDLYAHNILHNAQGESLLGDFGAASFYRASPSQFAVRLERLEVRAFGCFLEELLERCRAAGPDQATLRHLQDRCLETNPDERPPFEEIAAAIARC